MKKHTFLLILTALLGGCTIPAPVNQARPFTDGRIGAADEFVTQSRK